MKEQSVYDRVLPDLFQMDRPSLLYQLTGGVRVRAFLNVVFPRMIERRADLVVLLDDGSILHIEFQSRNDKEIAYRSGIYGLLIWHRHRCPVRQVVLYVGEPKLRMKSDLNIGGVKVSVRLMDIREIDSETLLRSGCAGDLALAMLAKGGTDRLTEIVQHAAQLSDRDRVRALTQLFLLSDLRRLSGRLKMEMATMGSFQIDVRNNEILRDVWEEVMAEGLAKGKAEGLAKGKAEGLAKGKAEGLSLALQELLQSKFGRVPKWASDRLKKADVAQLELWLNKVFAAQSIEALIGRK